jgi:predicted membrane protein
MPYSGDHTATILSPRFPISGGRWGVALAQTILAQRQQFHQSCLIEHITTSDVGYQQTIDAMTRGVPLTPVLMLLRCGRRDGR